MAPKEAIQPNAQARAVAILDKHDITTEEGERGLHNEAYFAGMTGHIEVLWEAQKKAKENPSMHEAVRESFENGKAQRPRFRN